VAFLARSLYRSRQFFRSVGASISDEESAEVAGRLSADQQRLFSTMTARDQRHSLDVLHVLQQQGQEDPELLAAALLHDVGKGPIRLWHRVAYVLLHAASPGLVRKAASDDGAAWRQALAACVDHAHRGAALVEAAGGSDGLVQLVLDHEKVGGSADPRVALLQAADGAC
jgi:hypothetical protein